VAADSSQEISGKAQQERKVLLFHATSKKVILATAEVIHSDRKDDISHYYGLLGFNVLQRFKDSPRRREP
jgi:hypothetical protein